MNHHQQQFIEFALKNQALLFGDFTLKSGKKSPYFFNAGELIKTGENLAKVGHFYTQTILDNNIQFDTLFGPAYKGIPLATATAYALAQQTKQPINYCFNRKETKQHGEGGNLVGSPLNGQVLIIDDVITAGTTAGEADAICKQHNAAFSAMLIMLDRQERDANGDFISKRIARDHQITVHSIITLDDIIDYLSEHSDQQTMVDTLRYYQAK